MKSETEGRRDFKSGKKKKKWLNWNNPKIEIGWGWMERYPGTHKESQIKAIIL